MSLRRITPASSKQRVKREPRTALGRFWAGVGLFWEKHHTWCLRFIYLLGLAAIFSYIFVWFKQSYYYENPHFTISIPPMHTSSSASSMGSGYHGDRELHDFEIRGNSLLSRERIEDYIKYAIYKIHEKKGGRHEVDRPVEISGFELIESDFVDTLKSKLNSVRDIKMVFETTRKKIVLTIEERQPLFSFVSLAGGSRYVLVADNEGMVFRSSSSDLPRIVLRQEDDGIEPGGKLPSCYRCMIHLIDANRRAMEHERLPGGIKQVRFLSDLPEDGIIVDLYNARRVVMVWEGMKDEAVESPKMLELLRDLNRVLSSPDSRDFSHFTAIFGEKKQISAKMPTAK